MNDQRIRVEAKSISNLLVADRYVFLVPHYQRAYSWTSDKVEQLWIDLLSAIKEKDKQYFLGSAVFRRGDGESLYIIDGQQRLATLTVILAVLRDYLEEFGQNKAAEALHSHIIRTSLGEVVGPILMLRDTDEEYLRDYIRPRRTDRIVQQSESKRRGPGRPKTVLIKAAHELSQDMVQKEIDAFSQHAEKVRRLREIASFVLDKAIVIMTIVDSDTDAYIVFETLNDRGLDLSIADLVKTYLFSRGEKKKRLDQMQSFWDRTYASIAAEREDFPRFLRYYWLSKHERVTRRKLFAKIKDYLIKEDPFKFAADLENEAGIYRSLLYPLSTDPNSADLTDLRLMGIHQHLPLLLAAKASGMSAEQFDRLVSVCTSLTVRYLIVGKQNPNRLEEKYSSWAIKLRSQKENAVHTIRKEAGGLAPKNSEFIERMKEIGGLEQAQARYILRKINEHVAGKELLGSTTDVHVEHILPENPSEEWEPYMPKDKQERAALIKKLGNQTLLAGPLNKKASNQGFQQKKKQYQQSQIAITNVLAELAVWDADAIRKRQEYFADLAPEIWAF